MPENTIITKIGAYDNPGVEKSLSSNVAISAENIKATGVHGLIEGTGITLVKDPENGTVTINGNNEIGISGKLPFNVDDSMYAVETSAGIYVGLNEYTTNEYFAGTFGTDFTNPYFILSGDLFSANENIKYMNLSINYKVDNGAGNPDFVYKNELKISGAEINENYVHYIPGYISTDSYSVFLNVQNNSPFKFTLSSESTQHTGDEIKINVLGIKYHYPEEYEEIVDENDVDKLIVFNKTITTIDAGDDSILVDDDDSTLDIGY